MKTVDSIKPWRLVKRQPTKPGFYWFRLNDRHTLSVIEVFRDAEKNWSVRFGPREDDVNFLVNYLGEWAGPIPRPRNEHDDI